jgi:glycine/sarcosine/betaine reductase complex component A
VISRAGGVIEERHGYAGALASVEAYGGPSRVSHLERSFMMDLRGKKVIALGERDGVPGPAVAECASRAGADVVLTLTACYV